MTVRQSDRYKKVLILRPKTIYISVNIPPILAKVCGVIMENTPVNWVKCGQCTSEFDFARNQDGCPFCGFGGQNTNKVSTAKADVQINTSHPSAKDTLKIPPVLENLERGTINDKGGAKIVGSGIMFNSFFPGKAILRILAHNIQENKNQNVALADLLTRANQIIRSCGLNNLRGFPSTQKESAIGRLSHHFIATFCDMGLIKAWGKNGAIPDWSEPKEVTITLTREGLEFARITNPVFDGGKTEQVLGNSEREWLMQYLRKIDTAGYKELSMLKQVFTYLSHGGVGNKLADYLKGNSSFYEFARAASKKARDGDMNGFKKQLQNLALTAASSKIALLRELGVLKNTRNDYTVIGRLDA